MLGIFSLAAHLRIQSALTIAQAMRGFADHGSGSQSNHLAHFSKSFLLTFQACLTLKSLAQSKNTMQTLRRWLYRASTDMWFGLPGRAEAMVPIILPRPHSKLRTLAFSCLFSWKRRHVPWGCFIQAAQTRSAFCRNKEHRGGRFGNIRSHALL
ncbi:uncharacterized protein SETTUDRAFT_161077 [Exserohilum turcica Et28A]|uniref:Uncharacterized protein n=1 Tax=Exserohilum turcicum (strain 28A) TaxID=671987 RepID=R0K346_EXST2|nr:uncharacterized protein SETTUDRAFT_161077 [Exserohilum turcica Et28A]EOA87528.1 hypothetical protein SETTUDRAFT_161077 [Exserohilum turcica Et28A]